MNPFDSSFLDLLDLTLVYHCIIRYNDLARRWIYKVADYISAYKTVFERLDNLFFSARKFINNLLDP